MPIANNVDNYLVGSQQVDRIYQGANIVWPTFTGLLDLYPNAAVAYSLRLLRADYAGAAIRVRRGSDNAEQDIGFVDNELDTAALLSFVSGGDGFITTWYDQSGNTRNATQSAALSQPVIVVAGVVQMQGANPSTFFSGGHSFRLISSASVLNNVNKMLVVSVNRRDVNTSLGTIVFFSVGTITGNARLVQRQVSLAYQSGGRRLDFDGYQPVTSADVSLATPVICVSYVDTTNRIIRNYINNTINGASTTYQTSGNTSPTDSLKVAIGEAAVLERFVGYIQEVVIYNTDQLVNVSGINLNINDFYNVY